MQRSAGSTIRLWITSYTMWAPSCFQFSVCLHEQLLSASAASNPFSDMLRGSKCVSVKRLSMSLDVVGQQCAAPYVRNSLSLSFCAVGNGSRWTGDRTCASSVYPFPSLYISLQHSSQMHIEENHFASGPPGPLLLCECSCHHAQILHGRWSAPISSQWSASFQPAATLYRQRLHAASEWCHFQWLNLHDFVDSSEAMDRNIGI